MEDQNAILAPLDPVIQAKHQKTRRELERRSLDRCEVFNPTDASFTTICNGYANTVAPGQSGVFFRYIAEKFATELVNSILQNRALAEIDKINKERADRGLTKIVRMEKNEVFARSEYNANDVANRRPLMQQIWKGIVPGGEYGMNEVAVQQQKAQLVDQRPTDEQLFDEIDTHNLVQSESGDLPIVTKPIIESQAPQQVEKPLEDLPSA